MRACEGAARRFGLLALPLHGDLSPEEQDRAVQPASQPKVIFSTNVAESSITIDGVTTVIDSGLARIASDSPYTGLPTLEVRRISKASAIQRAGRAGRTRPGRAIRLYTEQDFQRRPDHDAPEIRRRDLSQVVLELRALGVADLRWLEPPPDTAWNAAQELLDRLGAKEHARELARYPLHPRLSRLILEAADRGVAEAACRAAALLSSGDRLEHIDILDAIERELPPRAAQIERQIRRMVRPRRDRASEDALRIALLAAYPDRVGRRKTARDVQLCGGKPAVLASDYAPELLVAIDVEDRKESGPALIRTASLVKADWLLDLFPDRIVEQSDVTWNRTAERVEARSALFYDGVVIDDTRDARPNPEPAAQLLAQRAVEAGLHRFTDVEALEGLLARVDFASRHSAVRALTAADVEQALAELCAGLRSFAELKQAAGGLPAALESRAGSARLLDEVAPERLPLKGRQVRVHYANGQPPWIASRLQDFFGVKETPRIARGAVPVVVHLLAPNQRPVQMTTDLAGFWERLYPQVRRELSRRYPKHAWPEKPG
jgi:ATP-dependent helicase HrpB